MESEGPLHRPSTEIVTLLVKVIHLYIVIRRKHWYINYYVLFCILYYDIVEIVGGTDIGVYKNLRMCNKYISAFFFYMMAL